MRLMVQFIAALFLFSSVANAEQLRCFEVSEMYLLFRPDFTRIGPTTLTAVECQQVAEASREGVACLPSGGEWYPTLFVGDKRLGQAVSFKDCQKAVRAARAKLVCSLTENGSRPWRPTHTRSGLAHGRFGTSLDDCTKLTENASAGVVCTNTGTYEFRGRKPTFIDDTAYSDSHLFGASGQQEFCTRSTREARNGFVCACNGDFCAEKSWILYDLAKHTAAGSTTTLDACIQSQGK